MYQLRQLELEHLPDLMSLHRRVIKHIGGKKDLLIVEREDEYFYQVISRLGLIIGAFHRNDLIGYSSLRHPQPGEENFGVYAGLAISEFPFLAHSNGSMVSPEHRGAGLHQKMAVARATAARMLGLRHLLSEVHGSNPPSLRNLFALGFRVRGTKHEDEDHFLIFHHELAGNARHFQFEIEVHATDNQRQQELLAMGLVGYGLDEASGSCRIKYGRELD